MIRPRLVAGNWKMNTTPSLARDLASAIARYAPEFPPVEVVLCPPFTSLAAVWEAIKGTTIRLGAQNMHFESEGPFTGEISGSMLLGSGCSVVIIGHSERRQHFSETDQIINRKLKKALELGLIPIFCLGETLAEREGGRTFEVLQRQLTGGLDGLNFKEKNLIIAYEPVWAIGTGVNATPQQAAEAHRFLREKLSAHVGTPTAQKLHILYGGSVKAEVADGLFAEEEIDGALVGGASLKAAEFVTIVKKAK
ncbi:MAG TPA: triose-phosphate isomerase [Verrucomicrobiae bacterium]|nr:triose-phosphate isomerase [Verrucomicrobiae bacterium]